MGCYSTGLSSPQDMDGAPHRGSWETFTAVDAGGWEAIFPVRVRMPQPPEESLDDLDVEFRFQSQRKHRFRDIRLPAWNAWNACGTQASVKLGHFIVDVNRCRSITRISGCDSSSRHTA